MANEKRLIKVCDATAVYNGIALYMAENAYLNDTPLDVLKMVASWLNDAPTVDAVEVVHAHWEDGCAIHNGKEVYKSIDCSHCEEVFKIESETREYWKDRFKVCPFCGAVMDGERREGE